MFDKQSFDSLISLHSSQISRCRKMYTVYGRDYFKPVPVTLVVGNDGEVNQSFIEGEAKDSALASCFKGILKKFKFSKSKAPVSLKSTLP